MPPTIISKKASNWVDRGESPVPTLRRVLRGEVPVNEPTPDTFSHWVASKLLTSDELARFEEELDAQDDSGS